MFEKIKAFRKPAKTESYVVLTKGCSWMKKEKKV